MAHAKVLFVFKNGMMHPIETVIDFIPSIGHKIKFDYPEIEIFKKEFIVSNVTFFFSSKNPSVTIDLSCSECEKDDFGRTCEQCSKLK